MEQYLPFVFGALGGLIVGLFGIWRRERRKRKKEDALLERIRNQYGGQVDRYDW